MHCIMYYYVRSHHDCADSYGDVFVACRESLTSSPLDIGNTSCELITYQISLAHNSTLIACSIYWPPSSNNQYLN